MKFERKQTSINMKNDNVTQYSSCSKMFNEFIYLSLLHKRDTIMLSLSFAQNSKPPGTENIITSQS